MPEEILEPCPFDASRDLTVDRFPGADGERWFVRCLHCGAEGPIAESRAEAIRKWNARPKRGDGA